MVFLDPRLSAILVVAFALKCNVLKVSGCNAGLVGSSFQIRSGMFFYRSENLGALLGAVFVERTRRNYRAIGLRSVRNGPEGGFDLETVSFFPRGNPKGALAFGDTACYS